jgi:hypothetical protein
VRYEPDVSGVFKKTVVHLRLADSPVGAGNSPLSTTIVGAGPQTRPYGGIWSLG